MDQNRWQEIRAAFDEVVALDAGDRADRLASLGATDPALRAAVEKLLAADAERSERLRPFEGVVPPEAEPARDPFDLVGRTISHFQVVEPLGAGGMGVVYRAEDLRLGRAVALKFLLPHLGLDASAKTRFLREAHAAAALDHPNLCTIYDVGEDEAGRLFLAMALYPGETLKAHLVRAGPLPVGEALAIARQLAEGLVGAHAAGIVHRDLKPGNVMLLPDGTVKILDFGLARSRDESQSGASARWGTAAYMAPEQVSGQAADARADLWALGVVLYEMVTGKKPFGEGHEVATAHAILKEEPVPPSRLIADVAPPLEHVILSLLEKDPARRPASASSVIETLTAPGRIGASRWWRRPRRRLVVGLAAAGALAAAAIGIWHLSRSRGVPPPNASPTRIAVLPLQNLTGDSAQGYFVDGMHEAIIDELAKIQAVGVISRTSVLPFRGAERSSLPDIAKQLAVAAVVEGSVFRAGDSVRVSVQLIDGRTDQHLWSEVYVRDLHDVLRLYGELAGDVAGQIRAAVTPAERGRLASERLVDPDVYTLTLRGGASCLLGTAQGKLRGIQFLRQAVDRDPTYALAYARLGGCYSDLPFYELMPDSAAGPLFREATRRALELDSTLGEAYVNRGWIRFAYDHDIDGADQDFRRALALSPGSVRIRHWYSDYLRLNGRFDEAISQLRQAIALDPLSEKMHYTIGLTYYQSRRFDDAIAQLKRTLELAPEAFTVEMILAWSYSLNDMHAVAVAQCDSAVAHSPQIQKSQMSQDCAWVYARAGQRQRVLDLLRRHPAWCNAYAYVSLGDKESALECLRKERRENPQMFAFENFNPLLDPLRADPRSHAVLLELGIKP